MINIDELIKKAIKEKDTIALSGFRSLKAKIMLTLTAAKREHGKPLTAEEEMAAIKREIKERKESNEFLQAGDPEFESNQSIIQLLEPYLPQTLSPEETDVIIDNAIEAVKATSAKEMGKVMGQIKKQGLAIDMGYVSTKVQEKLRG